MARTRLLSCQKKWRNSWTKQDLLLIRQLLIEYKDMFSTQEMPLGQCDIVQHKIKTEKNTSGAERRSCKRGEQDERTWGDRMSELPWTAPVVLVREMAA